LLEDLHNYEMHISHFKSQNDREWGRFGSLDSDDQSRPGGGAEALLSGWHKAFALGFAMFRVLNENAHARKSSSNKITMIPGAPFPHWSGLAR
jgi:hypothetical protein